MANAKNFSDLTEREILALAISLEEEDERVYNEFAEGLKENFPDSAKMFNAMAAEESGHRHRLLDLYRARFGDHIPLIRRHDVKGFVQRPAVWLTRPLGLDKVREHAEVMEAETRRFYSRAARRTTDAGWNRNTSPSTSPKRSTRASGGCSCCRSCSPGSRG
jgi:rubrerythrin